MTIHKSKGKEFDAVIIYEDARTKILNKYRTEDEARLLLRVAATRAKKYVDILTPQDMPCPLL